MPYIDTPNQSIDVDGTAFAYRDLGPRSGVPLVLLNHWGAVLDNFDPRIVDGLARRHRIIAIDYRGIGASGGTAPVTIDAMARDAISLIHALGCCSRARAARRSVCSRTSMPSCNARRAGSPRANASARS